MFEWKGRKLDKFTEIVETALALEGKDQEDFVEAYCAQGPYARQNIGYFSGYYSPEKADKIQEIFKTSHPIFGRTHPTPEQAFAMGEKLGSGAKEN